MKICFVGPPSLTEPAEPSAGYRDEIAGLAEMAPIGILTLAAVLEQHGLVPRIVDLNRFYYDHLLARAAGHSKEDLCAYAAARLAGLADDLYAMGTISSSYPLTVRIARELKRLRPDATIVLEGRRPPWWTCLHWRPFSSLMSLFAARRRSRYRHSSGPFQVNGRSIQFLASPIVAAIA